MLSSRFFEKSMKSKKVNVGGPSSEQQLLAMYEGNYWTVLNSDILSLSQNDELFCDRANAFKHALQTFGPTSENLPDLRSNEGKAKNQIFHGHVSNSTGKTYVLEWAIISHEDKIMALVGFGSHENFKFKKNPLTKDDIDKILNLEKNKKIIENVKDKIQQAKDKVERVFQNYKNARHENDAYLKTKKRLSI